MLLSAGSLQLPTTLRCFSARGLSPVQCLRLFRNLAPLTSHVAIGSLHVGMESVAIRAVRSHFSALLLHASARWIIIRHRSF
jgi:hypothetical protein